MFFLFFFFEKSLVIPKIGCIFDLCLSAIIKFFTFQIKKKMNPIQYVNKKIKTTANKTADLKRQRMLLEMFYDNKRNFILNASKPQLRLVVQNIKARCALHFATKKNLDEVRDMNVPFGTPFCREAGLILVFVGGKTYIYFGVSKLREI